MKPKSIVSRLLGEAQQEQVISTQELTKSILLESDRTEEGLDFNVAIEIGDEGKNVYNGVVTSQSDLTEARTSLLYEASKLSWPWTLYETDADAIIAALAAQLPKGRVGPSA